MCGICGFAGAGEPSDLKRMCDAMVHRGPDAEGLWRDSAESLYLGHRRLSIIDLSGGGQPMETADGGLVVAYNGEIYNHVELRRELEKKGHVFRTDHSDTEVLLHGFREWGRGLPGRLDGMWAFAVFDRERRRLFLSRDRFGKKPLFYTLQHGVFAFASELSALARHPGVAADESAKNLKKYFAYGWIPAPGSWYEKIYKLPGGCNLTFDLARFDLRVETYWEFVLEPFESIPKHPVEAWGEHIRHLLERAVQRRLMSDVPLGVFLSGGVDSSAVAAFAARHTGGEGLRTFSIGFEEASFDESRHAEKVAKLLHTRHHLNILSMERTRELLPAIAARLDEPMGDSSLLPTFLLCRETRKHVATALGGDGGDELFAGYDPFRALKTAERYARLTPRPVHRAIRLVAARLPVSHRNISPDFKLKRTLRGLSHPPELWNPVWLGPLEPKELSELFREPCDVEEVYSEAVETWDACEQKDLIDKTLQFYTRLYLQNGILVKADRAGMMNSLEVRSPFLDRELVDFVRKIPSAWKLRHGRTKYILKKALEPVLPREIIHRPKKGFGVPVGEWFARGALSWTDAGDGSLLNRAFVQEKIREHREGEKDHRLFLWNIWLLKEMRGSHARSYGQL